MTGGVVRKHAVYILSSW